ncbi:TetR/AcrR family transcriptional regulator [Arthrobacter sp. 08Y14]|uniref:TetR/AcrR family transcriptional regulator n=1 Tax=Arthrobacter sp. 08Y14 TaxID=2058885 RepID=UPI000CE3F4A0|nr:TetR/AcrR family transcriptional regulator [Arthrobacter sp. 08Y14]
MPSTETAATRDRERTRKAIVEAASQTLFTHGGGVSLADIAAAAGVSKGALTHHFASRNALEEAILADVSQKLWDAVHARVDLSENRPGKLLRGYVRALTDADNPAVRQVFAPTSLLLIIGSTEPAIQGFLRADAQRWREAFDADGLDPATSLTIRYAAEGLAGSIGTPYLTASELRTSRARLLELAEPE